MTAVRPAGSTSVTVHRVSGGIVSRLPEQDRLATEEPLEIRLKAGREQRQLAITMRTPGNDFELAAGFLFAEGVIDSRSDLETITYCVDRELSQEQRYNVVSAKLRARHLPDVGSLHRHFAVNSACGVCGKTSLDAVERCLEPVIGDFQVDASVLSSLPAKLRDQQKLFETTGGIHAAALFSPGGDILSVREDVGRHNAVDKLVGHVLLEGGLPLSESIILVSGRASFELVQKAAAAGIPVFCAVSAPSSLAVDLARRTNITLAGFVRGDGFNIYSGEHRVHGHEA